MPFLFACNKSLLLTTDGFAISMQISVCNAVYLWYNGVMKVKVFAKLNLTLNVGAKCGQFHPVDSVATSIDLYDVVEVRKRPDNEVTVCGVVGVECTSNSAYRGAKAFMQAFGSCGVDINIVKGIPMGGGLGGSSADAVAVLYCMCKLFDVDVNSPKIKQICAKLGSDNSFMLFGGLGRMRGKGDNVEFHTLKRPIYFALTTFDVSMSSGAVYGHFDKANHNVDNALHGDLNDMMLLYLGIGQVDKALLAIRNDLQTAVMVMDDYAQPYFIFARSQGWFYSMTGSGSAYFVAFSSLDEAKRATDLLNANGFTTKLCQTVPHGVEEIE